MVVYVLFMAFRVLLLFLVWRLAKVRYRVTVPGYGSRLRYRLTVLDYGARTRYLVLAGNQRRRLHAATEHLAARVQLKVTVVPNRFDDYGSSLQ